MWKEKIYHGLETWTRQAPPTPAAPAPTNHGVLSLCRSGERDVTWLLTNEKETSSASAVMIGELHFTATRPEDGLGDREDNLACLSCLSLNVPPCGYLRSGTQQAPSGHPEAWVEPSL